jgi:hypothetical protein
MLGNPAVAASGTFESISTVTVSGTQSSITFTSIPSTYKHLQIRSVARDDQSVNSIGYTRMTVNSDTGTNYNGHALYANGSTVSAINWAAGANMIIGREAGSTLLASTFGANIIDILDYASTSKYKTVRSLSGIDANGSGDIFFQSGLWLNTAAINAISFTAQGGSNFVTGTKFALYGIKG